MLLDGGTPKVPPADLRKAIRAAGFEVSEGKADFGVVVGGDGKFSRYGRTERIPLLFVGVRAKGATGSRAHLAQANYDELPAALEKVKGGEYSIDEQRRLGVLKNGRNIGEVFTDAYLQRGSESACIRYKVKINGRGVSIEEAAVGDGMVVSTQAGSTGYFSYPDRIRGEWMDPTAFTIIRKDEVGLCHITPTFTERAGSDRHPLRYTVPWGCHIELSLFREGEARLYGTTDSEAGVKVSLGDTVAVVPGSQVTRVIVPAESKRTR